MAKDFDIQVPKDQYFAKYDHLLRFISYYYQVDLAKKLKPKTMLEIGIGNRTVSNYLKEYGFALETCDFDKELKPDHVADIRDLPMKDNSYDLVMACEIIEHIPWEDIDHAFSELHRVSKKHVLISTPYTGADFELIIKTPGMLSIFKKPYLEFFFKIPLFFKGIKFKGEHYWEMGRKGYPIGKVRKSLRKYFRIIREVRPELDTRHHFFVLEKK
ncbi:methyltransferase domain-containing protein [Candidatus Berkelbacteria bacterium]|nr:methyltransferase domain-containing protein [Candidatus Berkelbacteria bacterium]